MALAVTLIDTQASGSGAGGTRTLSVPVGGVPLGALVCVLGVENANVVVGSASIADAGGNTYTFQKGASHNNVQATGCSMVYTAPVGTALTSAQLITYTKGGGSVNARIVGVYVTGQDTSTPVDTTATASNFGSGTAVSVTSGTPANSGPLFLGFTGAPSGGTITQAGGSWSSLTNSTGTVSAASASLQGSGTATGTYDPSYSTSRAWSALILVVNPPISAGSFIPGWATGATKTIGAVF